MSRSIALICRYAKLKMPRQLIVDALLVWRLRWMISFFADATFAAGFTIIAYTCSRYFDRQHADARCCCIPFVTRCLLYRCLADFRADFIFATSFIDVDMPPLIFQHATLMPFGRFYTPRHALSSDEPYMARGECMPCV